MKSKPLMIVLIFVLFNLLRGSESASETLILGCGGAAGKDADGRSWESDEKYLAPGTSTNSAPLKAQYQDPALLSETPYMTARVFTSNATYKLPAKAGRRYWLRLHFYPAVYGTNDAETAFFNVLADGKTLLRNFSAAITCRALTQAYLVKEYALAPLASDGLSVTFEPFSADGFAFVNGLELVPIPGEDLFASVPVVGFSDQSVDVAAVNIQTVYRLNVGGQYISPTNDTGGFSRAWYDDFPYLYGAQSGVTNQAGPKMKIDYRDLPEYVAPAEVYNTARSMGNTKEINRNYNLTWVFQQIDPNFMYLVRLHFCDFHYAKPNEVVFNIYLNNQTAQSAADVIGWSGGKAIPTYKDYAVFVSKEEELWLAMNPATETKPEFYDAMLNGVEVFKVETSGSLAGPNPKPSAMLEKNEQERKKFEAVKSSSSSGSSKAKKLGGAAGGAAAVGIVAAALCVVVYQRKKKMAGMESHTSSWLPVYGNSHTASNSKSAVSGKSTASSHLSATAAGRCRRFTFSEMKKATRGFEEGNVVGVGGFGKVYKGVIDGGIKVAIKRSNPSSEQGVHEFQTEIEMLSELRHKHLVSLIGFCDDDNEMCLVYDYMARGTLREHLYRNSNNSKPLAETLTWKQRLEICIGAAKGLHYLHTGAKWTIIHRDVKTTNILLDESWVAKVSDFGLSKTGPDLSTGHVSTVVKGSFGYLDPEYFKRQQLTEKSDVYSFGVVLFEVLCARPALNPNLAKEQVSLADWALHCHRKGTLGDIIDPALKGKVDPESIRKFADTAQKCLSDHGIDRPTLNDILWNLEFALQLQENMDGTGTTTAADSGEGGVPTHYAKLSLGSDSDLGTDDTRGLNSNNTTAVFSQIVNPKGR